MSTHTARREMLETGRQWATAQRCLVGAAVALDLSGEWAVDGARTCAHWIAGALDVEVSTAREWLRVGHALARLDVVDAHLANGTLSYAKVRTITRLATPENQAELCDIARGVPAGRLGAALASWLARRETPHETEQRHLEARSFSTWVEPDGMVAGFFRIPPAQGASVSAAVEAVVRRGTAHCGGGASTDACPPQPARTWASFRQQRADALVSLITGGGIGIDTEVILHVRGDGCSLDDGTPISASVVGRMVPEAFLRALIHDAEGHPVNASGRQRHPSARQQRVVRERDRVCVDCGSTTLLQYDHDPAFEISGRTVVDELRLRCALCHQARHAREAPHAA